MFSDHELAAEMRRQQAENDAVDRSDLFSARTLATTPGGHGTQFGLPIPTLTGPDEAEAFVAARVAEGSDYLKIIIEDGAELGLSLPTLDQETVTALVQAAHEHGLLALVHVQTLAAAQQALAAGADGLAHIFVDAPPDETFVNNAVSSGLFVIPTLAVFQSIGGEPLDASIIEDPYLAPYLTQPDLQLLSNPYTGFEGLSLANGLEAVRQLHEAGAPILAGTDASNPGTTYGASLHRELVLLTEAGLSPLESLAAATSVTADIFSLSDRGRIAPGLRADLLLVNGDPTTEITATRDIVGVWKLGVRADREGYLANLEAQRAAAAEQAEVFAESDVVLVSDFESGDVEAFFGSGWQITTDQPAGGGSEATMEVVAGGANSSDFSLLVTGETTDDVPFAWAGVSFSPAAVFFAPFDLSSKPTLHFWARGEGGPYRVQLFCQNTSQVPPEQPFAVTQEWQEYRLDLTTFGDCDITGVLAVIFSAGTAPGTFSFQLDDVSFE
jgi:hypothetical protein